MEKVGIISFHAAHNYGSCLQAYAMQCKIESLGYDVEVINFRTERQKELYNVFTRRKGLKFFLKNIYVATSYKKKKTKYDKFESYIHQLKLTNREYSNSEGLGELKDQYYACVAGSDQIWNVQLADYDDAYMLNFVGENTKRIAYAPSCGDELDRKYYDEHIKEFLLRFDHIAVRDTETAIICKTLIEQDVQIVVDPTLLLNSEKYCELFARQPIIKSDYIFLYTLGNSKTLIELGKAMSTKFHMPVYISNITGLNYIFNFDKVTDSGPLDFLNLIYNAKYVITTSFHATIFSILFKKQFWTFGAEMDNRKRQLLTMFGLMDRNVNMQSLDKLDALITEAQYADVLRLINEEREKATQYLALALGGNK